MPNFNLPILDHLVGCRSILITGIGGGFDVFAGLPIYFTSVRTGIRFIWRIIVSLMWKPFRVDSV
jgi:hypothetical protein